MLAKRERGARTRKELLEGFEGVSANTYANFESGAAWPRHTTLHELERLLGWREGIVEEVMTLEVPPAMLTLEHMRGNVPLASPDPSLTEKPWPDLVADMNRITAEVHRRLAASQGGEDGIGPGDLPQE